MTPGRLGPGATLLVLGYAASILLLGLGGERRVLTRHEVFVAEPARTMLEGGPWIVPEFGGEPRLSKPPAMSWLVAGSFALLGRTEFAARLPSALSGVALAWIVAALAARWFGRRVGVLAGLVQATTAYQLVQARLAEADMPMAAAVAAALLCFALAKVDVPPGRPRPWLARGLLLAAGLSFLLKGVGPLLVLLAVGAFAAAERRRDALAFLLDPAGIALLLAALLAWPLLALAREPALLDVWRREALGRALGEMGERGPPFYYLYAVPLLLLPWLPYAVLGAFRVRRERARARFLACWVLPGLVLLTASAFRSKHYAIPLLPPFAVLAATGLDAALRGGRRGGLLAPALVCVGGAGAVAAAARWLAPHFPAAAAVIGILAAGVLATLLARRPGAKAALLFASLWVAVVSAWFLFLPALDDYRDAALLARRTNAAREAGEPVHLLRLGEAQVVFYLDRPVRRWDGEGDLEGLAAEPRPLLVLARAAARGRLEALGAVEVVDRAALRRREGEGDRLSLYRIR